jgi:hypothetical protein
MIVLDATTITDDESELEEDIPTRIVPFG